MAGGKAVTCGKQLVLMTVAAENTDVNRLTSAAAHCDDRATTPPQPSRE